MTILDEKTGKYYPVPVLPQQMEVAEGDKQLTSVNIVNLGAVEFPEGVELDAITWSSFFPARYDAGYVSVTKLLDPLEYQQLYSRWKDEGTPLRLIYPAAGLNMQVRIPSFSWELRGAEGDIYYSVTLHSRRSVKPLQISTGTNAPSKGAQTPANRPPKAAAPKPKTYTVKSGDTLIKIAKAHGIKDWRAQLYNPNKGVIGSNPDRIYPGQVLRLP